MALNPIFYKASATTTSTLSSNKTHESNEKSRRFHMVPLSF
jgi:hypothetical protein